VATTPLFTKTFDFISWLLQATHHFPRSQRFVVTKRLLDAALDFQELLVDANVRRGKARLEKLDLADAELDKVRLYLRLAFRWEWLSPGQYQHAAQYVSEMGKLLGSWKKMTGQLAPA
jgi:four helix bundle protein